jgi:hypothetical protein
MTQSQEAPRYPREGHASVPDDLQGGAVCYENCTLDDLSRNVRTSTPTCLRLGLTVCRTLCNENGTFANDATEITESSETLPHQI